MFELYSYSIPFKKPFVTGAGTFNTREGIILRYHDSQIDVVSEAAPLPGFSSESLKQVKEELRALKLEADRFLSLPFMPDDLNEWVQNHTAFPSSAFGLSALGLHVLSARKNARMSEILSVQSAVSLQVNAVIGSSSEDDFIASAQEHIRNGFNVIKCKVTNDIGHLPESIKKISETFPNVSFRLDANRSWKRENLAKLSSYFKELPIEYIEEPCRAESIDQLDSIITECELDVALDESLTNFGLIAVLEKITSDPYLVVKPMFHGNLMELFATIGDRFHLENRVIITTALESSIGTCLVAQAAAIIGSKTSAHGLNTDSFFRQNLAENFNITDGTIQLNENFNDRFSFQDINQNLIKPL